MRFEAYVIPSQENSATVLQIQTQENTFGIIRLFFPLSTVTYPTRCIIPFGVQNTD